MTGIYEIERNVHIRKTVQKWLPDAMRFVKGEVDFMTFADSAANAQYNLTGNSALYDAIQAAGKEFGDAWRARKLTFTEANAAIEKTLLSNNGTEPSFRDRLSSVISVSILTRVVDTDCILDDDAVIALQRRIVKRMAQCAEHRLMAA